MGVETAAMNPRRGWGTWEELILGGAVLRHGIKDWDVVAGELRARTLHPQSFTPEVCKAKYKDLRKRYRGSTAWFEELRKQRVAELKQELAKSEDSIGSLELKIKSLEAEKQNSNKAAPDSSWTESPLPALNSDGAESSCKTPKDETSAGSFTEGPRKATNRLCQSQELETDVKPNVSVSSSKEPKDLIVENLAGAGYGQCITKKRRGQRKRKAVVNEGSVGESDNFASSTVVSTPQKETCTRTSGIDGTASAVRKHNLMDIFNAIADSESAVVFRHRMDSQKRARYRKVILQHQDMDTIRSRIMGRYVKTAKELFRDLLLLANNALVFYSRRTREFKSALSLRHLVMGELRLHCRDGYFSEATSAFFLSFSPLVKPRSARPRPCPVSPPCKDTISEKVSEPDNTTPKGKTTCKPDNNAVKAKRGVKRPLKVKPEAGDKVHSSRPVKQARRRVGR